MTKRIVRAAAVQIAPDLDRADGTVEKVLKPSRTRPDAGRVWSSSRRPSSPTTRTFRSSSRPSRWARRICGSTSCAVTVPGPVTDAVAAAAASPWRRRGPGRQRARPRHPLQHPAHLRRTGALILKRRKITPTYHERMIWGQGDASGLKVVETAVGRIGALACWEHYNPLARYALMAQHEEIHCASFPARWSGRSSPSRWR